MEYKARTRANRSDGTNPQLPSTHVLTGPVIPEPPRDNDTAKWASIEAIDVTWPPSRLLQTLRYAPAANSPAHLSLKALVVVLEGTLVDTVPADLHSFKMIFSDLGYHVLPSDLYAGARRRIAEVLQKTGRVLGFNAAQVVALEGAFNDAFQSCVPLVQANTGIVHIVQDVARYLPVVLISERPASAVDSILRYHSLKGLFTRCELEQDPQARSGPQTLLRRSLGALETAGSHVVLGPSRWAEACDKVGMRFLDVQQVWQAGQAGVHPENSPRSLETASPLPVFLATMTLKEVARIAGVSTATVSRALNDPSRVSEERRSKIFAVVNDTGYVPNYFARSLVRQFR